MHLDVLLGKFRQAASVPQIFPFPWQLVNLDSLRSTFDISCNLSENSPVVLLLFDSTKPVMNLV